MTSINYLIRKESGRPLEILKELKWLNKDGYIFMTQRGSTFKPKYRALQKTDTWKKAKKLLLEYFTIKYVTIRCELCNKPSNDFVMHHVHYDPKALFSPQNISFIHKGCHAREHDMFK